MSRERIDLSRMFNARSIAVIGASSKKGKQGNTVVKYLLKYGYDGKVYPVNPQEKEIEGLTCYPAVEDIPGEVDLAIFCIPNSVVPSAAEQCVRKKVPFGVIWSAGFAEMSSDEGKKLDQELREICARGNLRVCGPNSVGMINVRNALVASFTTSLSTKERLILGRVAFVSQSGGTVASIIDDLLEKGLGFSAFVSTGNELNLTFSDYCLELLEYDEVKIIVGYIEGIRDGDKFIAAGRRARDMGKHIILVKGGRSNAAQEAVRSHTGAIAGSDGIYRAAFDELGIIQVNDIDELLDMVSLLSSEKESPVRFGSRTVVLCQGGGLGIQAVDAVERYGLIPAKMTENTRVEIAKRLPVFAGTSEHMVDVTPQLLGNKNNMGLFGEVLDLMAADPNVDVILFVQSSSEPTGGEIAEELIRYRDRSSKPLVLTWMALPKNAREVLQNGKIYVFPSQARAVQAITTLAKYKRQLPKLRTRVDAQRVKPRIAWPDVDLSHGPVVLTEDIVAPWLDPYKIGNAAARLVPNEEAAIKAGVELGYPLALKVIHKGLAHRSKYNLVALDIASEDYLRQKCRELAANAKKNLNIDLIDGFWVQQFRPKGLELILGGFRSEPFGHVMVCGIGGYLAEFFQPVYRLLPIDERETDQILDELPFLKKYPEEIDSDALKETLLGFSHLLMDCPWRQFELELNPVKVLQKGQGALAVDALAVIRK
ncbi:CoA-binding protein [Synergistales bacterium]|nr:CoA-binding protein [Synergistales bacterium]